MREKGTNTGLWDEMQEIEGRIASYKIKYPDIKNCSTHFTFHNLTESRDIITRYGD